MFCKEDEEYMYILLEISARDIDVTMSILINCNLDQSSASDGIMLQACEVHSLTCCFDKCMLRHAVICI